MISNFVHDMKTYSLSTAWFNLRFIIAFNIARALIREPIRLHVHDSECTEIHDETGWESL